MYLPMNLCNRPCRSAYVFSPIRIHCSIAKKASEGLYPAIDLLQSNSKMATPGIIGERHYNLAQQIRQTLTV